MGHGPYGHCPTPHGSITEMGVTYGVYEWHGLDNWQPIIQISDWVQAYLQDFNICLVWVLTQWWAFGKSKFCLLGPDKCLLLSTHQSPFFCTTLLWFWSISLKSYPTGGTIADRVTENLTPFGRKK